MIFKFTLRDIFFFLFAFACLCGAAFNKFADERRINELSLEVGLKKDAVHYTEQEQKKAKEEMLDLAKENTHNSKRADDWEGRYYKLESQYNLERKQFLNLVKFTDRGHLRPVYVPDDVYDVFNEAAFQQMGIRPYLRESDFRKSLEAKSSQAKKPPHTDGMWQSDYQD